MKDRITWLDKCKLIGIWLVIIGHLNISKDYQIFIYAFHMPLFFFISGYLYKVPDNFFLKLKKNISSLIWPYFTFYVFNWFILFILFFVVYTLVSGNSNITLSDTFIKPFRGMLYGVGYDTENSRMLLRPIWFLVALFIMKIIFDSVTKLTENLIIILTVSIVLWLVSDFLFKSKLDLYWSIDSAFAAIPFFTFGYILKNLKINFNIFKEREYLNVILSIILFIPLYFLSKINGSVDINGNISGQYPLLYFTNAVLGIIGVIMLSQLSFQLNSFFKYLSQNTLLILFLHYTFILIIFKIVPQNYFSDITLFILSIAILLLMYIPVLFINKYLPFVVSPDFKNKKDI